MKYYEDKSDRKMELKLLSLSEDDKLIRECMEQASAFYGCLGKMGVTEILCDRKKAQELGADCQITGIFTGGELTAFACAFEYTGLKRNGRKWLNPGDKEWRQIETLGTNVVVIPLLVGKEKVGRLIELLREQYRDSHLLFRISGEQSEKFQEDLAVVSEKNLKSHRYDAAGENVWLFHFAPQIRMEDTYFEEEILLILPGQEVLLEMGIEEAEVTMVKLTGYEIVRSEKGSAFFRKPGAACEGVLLQCDYEQLLRYQRFINLTNYEEHFEQTDRGKALIYSEKYQSDSSLLWNDLLREMVKTRKAEWSIVPDSYIMYPVTYKEQDRLLECACYDNQEIGNYMHYMDIRLQCETGVPFGKDGIDLMERYKNRLERIPLGRLRVRITLEMILDILDHEDQPVGCDAEAEAVLSIDRLSHIGVLTLVSLSTPFLLSHFLDNIVRNQLMVIEENGEAVNLYAYMQEKWGLNASGTPKSYEMIPKEKNCLNKKQLGAVLLSEAKYEKNEYDATRIEQYVKKVIAETRNLSNPFIERPLGEQKAPIAACTYSKELDPKDDSPRSMLIAKELGNYGGTPDEDIPLNMIMFYQSIYGLRANKLSKFSPGCAAEGRSDGEYYKAYYEVVSQIKPKSDKTPVITPHIDRNWHIVSALPDLDEENQRRQEREIYRAFALGIICDLVCYSKISEGKYLYRLELNDLEPEEFVVSNGTPCDHYYEVLDALTINPVAVQTILSYMKEKFADERNSSGKLDFEHSYLRRQINELASIEYGKAGLSIFDVALLLKVSTPSAEFDKTVGKGIMREILTLIYEYAQTMVLEADLDGIYGKFVLEQFEMFDKNIDWYMDNWKDNFSDYINDLMRIAVSDIERKKLTDIYEKMRKIMKESSKKRGYGSSGWMLSSVSVPVGICAILDLCSQIGRKSVRFGGCGSVGCTCSGGSRRNCSTFHSTAQSPDEYGRI